MSIKNELSALLFVILMSSTGYAQETKSKKVKHDFEVEIEGEYRYFFEDGLYQGQENHFPSLCFTPKYTMMWNEGYESISFDGLFRWDRDEQRTHWDVREFYYQKAINKWEFSIGFKKIFWGVTESNHLVDIVNQTDQIESFSGEAKLGQPMLHTTYVSDKHGTFDLFYLPFHRKRVFPGEAGRLRFSLLIEGEDLDYEHDWKEWNPGFAFRWSYYFNMIDIGLSQFYGSGREPIFTFSPKGEINALYPAISQSGLDIQITHSAFLWKLESIYRYAKVQNFFALTAGVEYTFSNINDKGLDIGILTEYLYDSRKGLAVNSLENDLFVGNRITFNDPNDTSILIGCIADMDSSSKIFSLEASRRFLESWTLKLEGIIFSNIAEKELILSNFREDSFFRTSISKFF